MKKKRITVLGGEGFVGRNILDYLNKDYECFSVAQEPSLFKHRNAKFIPADPYKEKVSTESEILIHLINNPLLSEEFKAAERNLIENTFTPNLCHVIVFSSAVVYAAPESDYGRRKILLEQIFQEECQKRGVKLTIFRLFNVYGCYQLPYRQGSLVANLIFDHLFGKTTEIQDSTAERDFLFAGDTGRFVSFVIENEKYGTFDLASNQLCSLGDMIAALEGVLDERLDIKHIGIPETVKSPQGKNPFLSEVEVTPLKVGLQETLKFYRSHGEEIQEYFSTPHPSSP